MRRWLTLLAVAAALFAVAFLGSPYWTVWRLSQAVKAGDARAVVALTDFPAVRANLKPQLDAWLRARTARERGGPSGWLGRLEAMLAPALLGSVVDLTVTPETLTAMLRTARAPDPGRSALGEACASGPRSPTDTHAVHVGYVGGDLDLFGASIASRSRPERSVTVKLVRRGLLTWRVTEVDLPASALR